MLLQGNQELQQQLEAALRHSEQLTQQQQQTSEQLQTAEEV